MDTFDQISKEALLQREKAIIASRFRKGWSPERIYQEMSFPMEQILEVQKDVLKTQKYLADYKEGYKEGYNKEWIILVENEAKELMQKMNLSEEEAREQAAVDLFCY